MKVSKIKINTTIFSFFLGAILLNLGCSKDSDLLFDSVLSDESIELEEIETNTLTPIDTTSDAIVDSVDESSIEVLETNSLETRTISFSPTNDAHVQSGKGYNQNIIRLDEENRTSYLMFDLSPISTVDGSISAATLQFTIDSDNGNGNISVFKGNSSDWSEHNLTESNIPEIETEIGSIIKEYELGDTQFIYLDVTTLKTENSTLILSHQDGDDLAFASKEHVSQIGPKLVVTYEVNEGAEEVVIVETTEEEEEEEEETTANENPIAIADALPSTGEAPLNVTFTGSNSTDDNAITKYTWNFADGSTSSSPNPSHTFTTAGNYTVVLTVEDADGATNTNSITISISDPVVSVLPGYYVATNGNSSNSGTSPSSPWSLEHAFLTADAGDIVYVKAGNYGFQQLISRNNGNSGNPIKFIGYKDTPGDIISNQGSTFNYGESVDENKMPLLKSSSGVGTALTLHDANIEIENFQITGYEVGVQTIAVATNVKFKNIIITKLGSQNSDVYKGFGFDIKGNYSTIENCLVYNAGAEAFKLSGASNSLISYCKAYSDNYSNPTDYYFLITGGTNNSIVEHSLADRVQEISHPGHGFILKDLAENNTIRNCIVKNTKLEMNFSGVKNNVIDNCTVIGRGTSSADWEAAVVIKNGANNNVIKNTSISNANWAINLADDDDGYVGPDGDRDEVSLGYNNTFDNITINNVYQMLRIGGGDQFSAKASDYTFKNCSLQNFEVVAVTYYITENFLFQNCTFSNGNRLVIEFDDQYEPYSTFDVTWQNCQWSNVNFNPPN